DFVHIELIITTLVIQGSDSLTIVGVAMNCNEARQLTEFRVRLGNHFKATARERIPVIVTEYIELASANLETNVTTDFEAGFCARDVEVAGAECVANANVFHGLRLSSDDRVG